MQERRNFAAAPPCMFVWKEVFDESGFKLLPEPPLLRVLLQ